MSHLHRSLCQTTNQSSEPAHGCHGDIYHHAARRRTWRSFRLRRLWTLAVDLMHHDSWWDSVDVSTTAHHRPFVLLWLSFFFHSLLLSSARLPNSLKLSLFTVSFSWFVFLSSVVTTCSFVRFYRFRYHDAWKTRLLTCKVVNCDKQKDFIPGAITENAIKTVFLWWQFLARNNKRRQTDMIRPFPEPGDTRDTFHPLNTGNTGGILTRWFCSFICMYLTKC